MKTNPANTYTIGDFILSGKNVDISFYNSSILEVLSNNTEVTIHNVFNDYKEELIAGSVDIVLTDKEYNTYKYNPRSLSYTLYGYTDLYFIIMMLNDIISVKDFTKRKIKVLSPNNLELLGSIINAEKVLIKYNRDEIGKNVL